jgi:hypothetical protein
MEEDRLSPQRAIDAVRKWYDNKLANNLLYSMMKGLDPSGGLYIKAISDTFYSDGQWHDLNDDGKITEDEQIKVKRINRERCLITLIAAAEQRAALGVHLGLGLMAKLSIGEVEDILLLTGMYAGVSKYLGGFKVLEVVNDTYQGLELRLRGHTPTKDPDIQKGYLEEDEDLAAFFPGDFRALAVGGVLQDGTTIDKGFGVASVVLFIIANRIHPPPVSWPSGIVTPNRMNEYW